MNVPPEFRNLLIYLLQVALLITLGGLLRLASRIRLPRVLLIYWQVLLILSLVIPLAAPRKVHTLSAPAAAIAQSPEDLVPAPPPTARRITHVDWTGLFWQALLPVLGFICVVRVGRLALGMIRLRHLRSRARRFELPASGFETIAPLRGNCDFFISSDIPGPATYGLMHSTILLPQQFEDLDVGSQLSIVCHELIHVRRHDWLFAVSEKLIAAIFWLHPAVSWLIHRIELVREQLVDREVLELSVDRRQYLRSLLFMAGGPQALLSANLFLAHHHLKERIAVLWEEVHMSRKRLVISLMSAMVLFFVGTVIFTYAFPLTQTVILKSQIVAARPAIALPIATETAKPPQAAPAAQARVVRVAPKPVVVSPTQAVAAEPQQEALAGQAKVVPIAPPPVAEPDHKANMQKSIAGVVVDPDGIFLPGVDIRVTDPDTNDILVTGITDDQGTFRLLVPSAKPSVDFTFGQEGFKPSVIKGVKTIDNAPVSIRLTMQIASATCAVSVKPGAKMMAFVSPTPVSGRAIPAVLYWENELAYPSEALQRGLEAVVMAEVKSEVDGMISAVRILKGDPHFDEAVMNAVRQWRCRPAYLNGKPHQSVNTVTVKFSLK